MSSSGAAARARDDAEGAAESTDARDELGPTLRTCARRPRLAAAQRRSGRSRARPPRRSENQVRPVRGGAQPTVEELKPGDRRPRERDAKLTTTFNVLNEVLNALAYNPKGNAEGYLF